MPRVTGTSKRTAKWNISDNPKFQKLAHKGKIDIDNITPVFIETIRKNTAGRIVQPQTSAQITAELQTLSNSPETSTGREHLKVSLL
jgi:hypothetical protein